MKKFLCVGGRATWTRKTARLPRALLLLRAWRTFCGRFARFFFFLNFPPLLTSLLHKECETLIAELERVADAKIEEFQAKAVETRKKLVATLNAQPPQ